MGLDRLSSLSPELFAPITEYLDDCDLLNLRMASHQLNLNVRHYHLNSLYRSLNIFLYPNFLRNLIKISQDPSGLNLRVYELKIQSSVACIESNLMPQADESSDEEAMLANSDDLSNDMIVSLLSVAIANLPNLRSIVFVGRACDTRSLSRPELQLLLCSGVRKDGRNRLPCLRGMEPKEIADFDYDHHDVYMDVWSIAIDCIVYAQLEAIKRKSNINIVWDQAMPLDWFSSLSFTEISSKPSFSNLKRLRISILGFSENDVEYALKDRDAFYKFLKLAGKNLEELCIEYTGQLHPEFEVYPKSFSSLPSSLRLPNLRNLCIRHATFEIKNFNEILEHIGPGLRDLRMYGCKFESPKDDWFSIFKKLRNRNLEFFANSGYGDGYEYSSIHMGYALPVLRVIGPWDGDGCCIGRSRRPLEGKTLAGELDRCEDDVHAFWDSLTDHYWEWPMNYDARSEYESDDEMYRRDLNCV